jgi:hypothetical protein
MRLSISAALAAVVVSAMSGTLPASAQWWNPLAPSDFEECSERAAKEAKTSDALNILLQSCSAKFTGRRKPGGGYTFLDARQNRSFPIAGPNPTAAEVKYFDEQHSLYLKNQQEAATAYAERGKQAQELEAERQKAIQKKSADLQRRRQATLDLIKVTSNLTCQLGNCLSYEISLRIENQSIENVSSVSVGWVLVPPQETCPTTVRTKETVRVNLRPTDSTAAHFNGFDGPSLAQVRYCVTATDVQIAP